jgi:hypothetical protein
LNPVRDTGDVKSGIDAIGFCSSGEDNIIGLSTIEMHRRNLKEPEPTGVAELRLFILLTGSKAGEQPSSPDISFIDVAASILKIIRLLMSELTTKGLDSSSVSEILNLAGLKS